MKFIANRSFIVVRPKAPFVKWVNGYNEGKVAEEDLYSVQNLYMIEELEEGTPEEIDKFIKKHYKEIFINQLWEWYTDENYIPEKLSFEMFKGWFEYESIEMCWDTLKSKLLLEDD